MARRRRRSSPARRSTRWAPTSARSGWPIRSGACPRPTPTAFPEDRSSTSAKSAFLPLPAEEVRGHFARFGLDRGVELVEGFFDETLPRLRDRRWSVVRLDGDTYEATWVGLESLYPGLSAGGYLIVDDYGLIGECEQAVEDYRREHGITEPIEKIDWNGVRWRREDEPDPCLAAADADPARAPRASPCRDEARRGPTSPPLRELELERELTSCGRGSGPPSPSSRSDRLRHRGHRPGETYDRCAAPGIGRAAEPDSRGRSPTRPPARCFATTTCCSTRRPSHEDLEALVLAPPGRRDRRRRLRREDQGGAQGSRRRDRWLRRRRRGAQHRLVAGRRDLGGDDPPLPGARGRRLPGVSPGARTRPVVCRARVRSTRSTASSWCSRRGPCASCASTSRSGKLHGYDFDICMQARAAGKKVVDGRLPRDPPPLARADQRSRGLDRRLHQAGGEVGRASFRTRAPTRSSRALRAEAEAACARGIAVSYQLRFQALQRQRDETRERLDAALEERDRAQRLADSILESRSWRLTEPFRALRRRLRSRS